MDDGLARSADSGGNSFPARDTGVSPCETRRDCTGRQPVRLLDDFIRALVDAAADSSDKAFAWFVVAVCAVPVTTAAVRLALAAWTGEL